MEWNIDELLERLQTRDECDRIEAKEACNALGKSPLETISAFSNEPDLNGGYLILGLKRNEDIASDSRYIIQGVNDPDKVQLELVNACRNNFNIRISPRINIDIRNGKSIIWAFIPEAHPRNKPVFIESKEIKKGSFRRIGPSDQLCAAEDIDSFYQLRAGTHFESETIPGVTWEDISPEAIKEYRRLRAQIDPNANELELEDRQLLLSLKTAVQKDGDIIPTVGGLVLFGSKAALRREMPMATRLDFLIVEGTEWVQDPSKRYHYAIEYREALVTLMPHLYSQIMSDMPSTFRLEPGKLQRNDIPLYPRDVIREALANLLMHRDYRSHQPTLIIRYSNRLEFRNAGYSLKPIEEIGEAGSKPRNPLIAAVFHELKHAETKGTGIRSMKIWMKEAGLTTPPIIESKREGNEFDLILLPHHLLNKEALVWLSRFKEFNLTDAQRRALVLTYELGAITNQDYRQLNGTDTLTATAGLRGLRDAKLLEQKGKGNGTYYKLSSKDLELPVAEETPVINLGDKTLTPGISLGDKALTPEISPESKGLDAIPEEFANLPEKLKRQISGLGNRSSSPEEFKDIIKQLCSLGPLTKSQLANILNRTTDHLGKEYLSKMIQSGELAYLHKKVAHPQQAYITPKKGEK
ncbi:putative DNA binding domain-containing protein [Chlamydiales bacterium]|nr:putative DNA binding domain-containing protein [Chlamydiales bacterium]